MVLGRLIVLQTQSNGVLREMLLQRQTDLEQAESAITKMIWTPLNDLWHEFSEFDDEPINEVQAHHHDQNISRGLAFIRHGYRWRDSVDVEAARGAAAEKISALVGILNDIHAPAHTDQHDEDRSISDGDWQEFLARGETAKGEVEPALRTAREAAKSIFAKMKRESTEIQDRLKKLDRALVAH